MPDEDRYQVGITKAIASLEAKLDALTNEMHQLRREVRPMSDISQRVALVEARQNDHHASISKQWDKLDTLIETVVGMQGRDKGISTSQKFVFGIVGLLVGLSTWIMRLLEHSP